MWLVDKNSVYERYLRFTINHSVLYPNETVDAQRNAKENECE
jgi:hypothetical protein